MCARVDDEPATNNTDFDGLANRGSETTATLIAIKGKEQKVEQRKQQILLVEDDSGIRVLLTMVLEYAGYAITAVEDVHTAREVLRTTSCDVLVTDYHLPDTYGNVLVNQAKIDQPGIATVLISAEPGVEYLAYQCGAGAWFLKGERLDGLIAAVAKAREHAVITDSGMTVARTSSSPILIC